MKCMNLPQFKSLTKLFFLCLSLFVSLTVFSQPLTITNSTSSGQNQDLCIQSPNKSATFIIRNNLTRPIELIDFTGNDFTTYGLPSGHFITNVNFTNDGYSKKGKPIWHPGSTHTVVVTSSCPIGHPFSLHFSMNYRVLKTNQIRQFYGSNCFIHLVLSDQGGCTGMESSFVAEESVESILDASVSNQYSPILNIMAREELKNVTVFITGITNPGYRRKLDKNRLVSGNNEIQLEELPTGIYQVTIQNGRSIKRVKYAQLN